MTPAETAAQRAIHDSYLRLREMLAPWGAHDTDHGGSNRFFKTEEALDALLREYEAYKRYKAEISDVLALLTTR